MKPAGEVVTCHPTDSLRKVVELMSENKIGAVVVVAIGNGIVPGKVWAIHTLCLYHFSTTI